MLMFVQRDNFHPENLPVRVRNRFPIKIQWATITFEWWAISRFRFYAAPPFLMLSNRCVKFEYIADLSLRGGDDGTYHPS